MYNLSIQRARIDSVRTRVAVAFTGPSGSGKTTLVEKVSQALIGVRKVAIIKNDPKDKAIFDVEGKIVTDFFKPVRKWWLPPLRVPPISLIERNGSMRSFR